MYTIQICIIITNRTFEILCLIAKQIKIESDMNLFTRICTVYGSVLRKCSLNLSSIY